MSTEHLIKAWDGIKNDPDLTNCEKLVLLRWAWKSRAGAPAVVRYKTYARELGMSVNGVKQCVRGLIAKGYLSEIAVVVTGGEKMQVTEKQGGDHPVTPGGSPSDPQRDHPVTPLQNNKNKNTRARGFGSKKGRPTGACVPSEIRSALLELQWPSCDDREQIVAFVKARGFGHLVPKTEAVCDV